MTATPGLIFQTAPRCATPGSSLGFVTLDWPLGCVLFEGGGGWPRLERSASGTNLPQTAVVSAQRLVNVGPMSHAPPRWWIHPFDQIGDRNHIPWPALRRPWQTQTDRLVTEGYTPCGCTPLLKKQTTVTAYFSSEQLLLFVFARIMLWWNVLPISSITDCHQATENMPPFDRVSISEISPCAWYWNST